MGVAPFHAFPLASLKTRGKLFHGDLRTRRRFGGEQGALTSRPARQQDAENHNTAPDSPIDHRSTKLPLCCNPTPSSPARLPVKRSAPEADPRQAGRAQRLLGRPAAYPAHWRVNRSEFSTISGSEAAPSLE